MTDEHKRTAASVLARLKNVADRTGEQFNPLLSRYVGYRWLYRLSTSPHRDRFLLKGATMFLFWTGAVHRLTRDIDLLLLSASDADAVATTFRAVCAIECPQDGVLFDPDSVRAQPIRIDQAYGGIRVMITAHLGTARVPVQVDVGLGDAVTPGPLNVTLPSVIEHVPNVTLLGYPVETAIAEKFEAMVTLGTTTSRMKDFFDIAFLADTLDISSDSLRRAVSATFRRRGTALPASASADDLVNDSLFQARWQAFVRKNAIVAPYSDLGYVASRIELLLTPVLHPQSG